MLPFADLSARTQVPSTDIAAERIFAMATTNEVAFRVLTNQTLLTSITAFSSGVSYFVYQVKQTLVCASNEYDPDSSVSAEDVVLWQNAICSGDRRTLEALQVLSKATVLGERLCKALHGIVGFALTHTKDMELLEFIDDDDLFPNEDHYALPAQDERVLGTQGDLELLKWMLNRHYTLSAALSYGAASSGHLEVLQYLHGHEELPFGCKGRLMKEAAANGHLDVVRFLHENRQACNHYASYHRAPSALDEAAMNGYLNIVKYLHENDFEACSHHAMDGAAGNGHLEVVQFLHENRREGCTSRAMDDAVKNNYFEIVKFLHENGKEKCSRGAMEDAIRKGDFDLLKRLCEHRGEGSLEGAIQFAAKRGQIKFVKFLYEAIPKDTTPSFLPREDLVNHAAMNGCVDLIKYFHKHAYFRFSVKAMHNAAISNHLHVVKFLHEHRQEGCKVDTLFECDKRELPRIVDFLCSRRPMENPERAIARAKREGRPLLAAKLEHSTNTAKKLYMYR